MAFTRLKLQPFEYATSLILVLRRERECRIMQKMLKIDRLQFFLYHYHRVCLLPSHPTFRSMSLCLLAQMR